MTDDMKFCEKCGQRVGAAAPTVVLSKMPQTPPARSNKTTVIILGVVCGVLLVALGAVCAILAAQGGWFEAGQREVPSTPSTTVYTELSATVATTMPTTTTETTVKTTVTTTTTTTTIAKGKVVTPSDYTLSGTRGRVVTQDGDGVNVRLGPSTGYEVLTGLPERTVVDVLAEQNGWFYVEHRGYYGWVSGEFLLILP